jgi:hypothetical protein
VTKKPDHLKPTGIPEDVIEQLVESLKIDTATAVDFVVFLYRETKVPELRK